MNATMNASLVSCSSLINTTAQKIGVTIAYCLILVVSLVANSFIALIVYKTQSMRKPINFFIVNMAISDLLYPIFVFPRELTELYANGLWLIGSGPLGQALCKLYIFVVYVSAVVSIQSLVLIAVDRFGAVVFPLRSPLISSKLCPLFIMVTWIVAMAVCSPMLLAGKVVENEEQQSNCKFQGSEVFKDLSSEAYYFRAIYVILNYIPLVLLAILYSIILIKLKSQRIPGEQSVNADERRAKRNRNVLKMAIAIVMGFALCWFPFSIYELLTYSSMDVTFSCEWGLYWKIAIIMCYTNCVINPCICFIFSENYRRGITKLLNCSG